MVTLGYTSRDAERNMRDAVTVVPAAEMCIPEPGHNQ